jgi:SagB-type dehydrogenase family enzyme
MATFSFFDPNELFKMKESTRIIEDLWDECRPRATFSFPEEDEKLSDQEGAQIPIIQQTGVGEFEDTILRRRSYRLSEFEGKWSKEDLLKWARLCFGISGEKTVSYVNESGPQTKRLQLRTYPSGGSLLPIEIHLHIRQVDGIEEGLYRLNASATHFTKTGTTISLDTLHALSPLTIPKNPYADSFAKTNVLVFLVANYERGFSKYGMLVDRLAALEAGHIAQNIQLVATSLQKKSLPMCAFYDDKVESFLSLETEMKRCLYLVALG